MIALSERRSRALLAYLAANSGTILSRDRLASLFWPDANDGSGRASLRQAMSAIRKALEPRADKVISADRDTVVMREDAVATDLSRLHALSETPEHPVPEDIPSERTILEGLRGFSADFDNWCAAEQERLSALRRDLLGKLADRAEAEHRSGDAMSFLARALAFDPLDEAFRRRLMRLYAAQGRANEALSQFRALEALLENELGVRPEPTTLDLVRQIRARRQSRPQSRGPEPAKVTQNGSPVSHDDNGTWALQSAKPRSLPATRYAKRGQVNIAYQVSGSGPIDIVWIQGWVSNLDFAWTHPVMAYIFDRLGSVGRLIRFDKSGTGLSDRDVGMPTLGDRTEDIRTIMDAVGSERAVLLGSSEAGAMSILFAATYPERTAALVLYGCYARGLWAEDYPWRDTTMEMEDNIAEVERNWGGPFDLADGAPSLASDPAECDWFAGYLRASASPHDAMSLWRWGAQTDVRSVLSAIHVPTLVVHRTGERWARIEEGRFLADHISGAMLVELPGEDHLLWAGDTDRALDEIERFIATVPQLPSPTRALATILHMRVGTPRGSADAVLLEGEFQNKVQRCGGLRLASTPEAFIAAFDRPTEAIRCATALATGLGTMGMFVRIGIHTGECERRGMDWTGVAISIAGEVAGHAEVGETVISQTVKDLIVGSDVLLDVRKSIKLSAVPGTWKLYAVASGAITGPGS